MRGLTLRVSLILAGALILVAAAWVGAFRYQQSLEGGSRARLPLPEQAAAIVEVVEAASPQQLPLLLSALNSPSLEVSVSAQMPPADPGTIALPGVSWATHEYLSRLGDRPVRASIGPGAGERPVDLTVGLRDGRYVTLQARGGILRYLLGMRLATTSMLALCVIGGLSLWLLRRQLRPLEQMVTAVERFGESLDAPAIQAEGALEVRRLVAAFNRMQTRIRSLVEGRTRMLAAISHDLGTYLTRLRLRVEYIGDTDQRTRAVADIEAMQSLMDDTLALGKLEQDGTADEDIDLGELVRRYAAARPDRPLQLAVHGLARVRGRRAALERVLDNLAGNALKHAGGAELTVETLPGPGPALVELRVEDRGPGIPAAARELVLEPFYRGDAARNLDTAGFGLGLSIVADIVRRHRGSLTLEDRPGGGLCARVRLPAA